MASGKEESVEEIVEKKGSGETLSRSEAGKLGGTAYKAAERARETGGEKSSLEDIQRKQAAGEPLTAHERGVLGGHARRGGTTQDEPE